MTQKKRPRRLRTTPGLRKLTTETRLQPCDLIMPVFVKEGLNEKESITTMPGIFRHALNDVIEHCKAIYDLGIPGIALFPSIDPSKKDNKASEALNPDNIFYKSITAIKNSVPELSIITDIALDPYSADGHDGLVENGEILNDKTNEVLAKMAVLQAKAGADCVAPSDMMDGRVAAIRNALETSGFHHTAIMSYSAKYASELYGPFRDALDSAPKAGDKKSYQMNPANRKEALKEAQLDEEEGADILLVKPASIYLDIISDLSQSSTLPIAAYHVSGSYSMLKLGEKAGILNYMNALTETLISIKRAGANHIITYGAMDVAKHA